MVTEGMVLQTRDAPIVQGHFGTSKCFPQCKLRIVTYRDSCMLRGHEHHMVLHHTLYEHFCRKISEFVFY